MLWIEKQSGDMWGPSFKVLIELTVSSTGGILHIWILFSMHMRNLYLIRKIRLFVCMYVVSLNDLIALLVWRKFACGVYNKHHIFLSAKCQGTRRSGDPLHFYTNIYRNIPIYFNLFFFLVLFICTKVYTKIPTKIHKNNRTLSFINLFWNNKKY